MSGDFLSKLKSNIGECAEDTSYTTDRRCFAEGGAVGQPHSFKSDRSLRNYGSSDVTSNSLKNIWSSSDDVPHFKKGGTICIEIDGGHMIEDEPEPVEIDGGFMIPIEDDEDSHVTKKSSKIKAQAKKLARMGRDGDTELVHVNKDEEKLLKAHGGRGSINPETGLREYSDKDKQSILDKVKDVATWSGIGSHLSSINPFPFCLPSLRAIRRNIYNPVGTLCDRVATSADALNQAGKGFNDAASEKQKLTGKDLLEENTPTTTDGVGAGLRTYARHPFPLSGPNLSKNLISWALGTGADLAIGTGIGMASHLGGRAAGKVHKDVSQAYNRKDAAIRKGFEQCAVAAKKHIHDQWPNYLKKEEIEKQIRMNPMGAFFSMARNPNNDAIGKGLERGMIAKKNLMSNQFLNGLEPTEMEEQIRIDPRKAIRVSRV